MRLGKIVYNWTSLQNLKAFGHLDQKLCLSEDAVEVSNIFRVVLQFTKKGFQTDSLSPDCQTQTQSNLLCWNPGNTYFKSGKNNYRACGNDQSKKI